MSIRVSVTIVTIMITIIFDTAIASRFHPAAHHPANFITIIIGDRRISKLYLALRYYQGDDWGKVSIPISSYRRLMGAIAR